MREHTIKLYQYDELNDKVKQKVLGKLRDLNVDHEWWDFIYADAEQIGIKLTGFDLDRNSYCKGEWIDDPRDVATSILVSHGDQCKTHKTATQFLADWDKARTEMENSIGQALQSGAEEPQNDFEDTNEAQELEDEFLHDLLESYRIMLQQNYDYLTSDESIEETIRANEYEFTEDGALYKGRGL